MFFLISAEQKKKTHKFYIVFRRSKDGIINMGKCEE